MDRQLEPRIDEIPEDDGLMRELGSVTVYRETFGEDVDIKIESGPKGTGKVYEISPKDTESKVD